MTNKGFTLIEVLVTTGVIGTLVGITLPALSKVRDTNRNLQCQTNLRQWGTLLEDDRTNNKGNDYYRTESVYIDSFIKHFKKTLDTQGAKYSTSEGWKGNKIWVCPSYPKTMGDWCYEYIPRFSSQKDTSWKRLMKSYEDGIQKEIIGDAYVTHNDRYNYARVDGSVRSYE